MRLTGERGREWAASRCGFPFFLLLRRSWRQCPWALAGSGSLLGTTGHIVIPALTLLFQVDIRYAVGASIVSVIATSSGAAAAYVRERLTNLRVAMFLELATTAGALTGAVLAGLSAGAGCTSSSAW